MPKIPVPETVSPSAAPATENAPPTAALELHALGWPTASQRIGKYQLVREIATGGMGVVFEALQDQPKRIVALKLMRTGFGSAEAIARFEHESQLLARLQHPGIAQVFEAGTHLCQGLAVPYFVMEHLRDAQFITEHARRQNLPLRRRLELMIQVCDAVQHGHDKGIIHRDLKPANILVDSSGRPKVIDFGVAHAADADQTASAPGGSADTSRLIGTLPYMSPEQCRSAPPRTELDTRSDVYSLGVVLYELLCGQLPYDIHRSNVDDATKIICQEPPQRPSKISRALRGDLEAILLKALHKDRDQRYSSAADLGRDLGRVLRCEPVTARESRPGYASWVRVTRFLARHWITTALLAILLGVVTAQLIAVPLVYEWTRIQSWFERFATVHFAPAMPMFSDVRIIALTGRTNIPALASEQGIAGVTSANRASFRRVHGRMMEKLATVHPKVVVLNIQFEGESEFDEDFVKGVRALRAAGCDVFIGLRSWKPDPDGKPPISRTIAPEVKLGAMTSVARAESAWRADMAVQQGGQPAAQASASLQAAASFFKPGDDLSVDIGRVNNNVLEMRFSAPDPTKSAHAPILHSAEMWRITGIEQLPRPRPDLGLDYAAKLAVLMIDVPSDEVLRKATVDYREAMEAAPEKLQEEFADRVVVIGDATPAGLDSVAIAPDGRRTRGHVVQALAIDSLIRRAPAQTPIHRDWNFGLQVPDLWLIDGVAALLGVLAALAASRSFMRLALLLALAAGWLLFTGFAAYLKFHYLCNPVIAIVAMLVASVVTASVERMRRRVSLLA